MELLRALEKPRVLLPAVVLYSNGRCGRLPENIVTQSNRPIQSWSFCLSLNSQSCGFVLVAEIITRHRASTSMYSLTFGVRVTTPPQYGRNGTASFQITSCTQQARRFYRRCVRACVVCMVGLADYRWALPHISSVANAIATQPVHRLQIRPIVQN